MKKTAYDFLLEAEEHLRRDNLQEALNLATERLRDVPTDAAALGIYCDALIGMGRIEDTRKVLQEVPKIIDGLNLVFERAGDACREKGMAVIFTRHLLRPDLSNFGVFSEIIPSADYMLDSHPAAAFHPAVRIREGDIVLEKPRFGAFSGTDLNLILRGKGIDTVIIGGIATNICCETTAREANHLEYKVIFLSDGTAARPYDDIGFGALSAEDVQRATCTVLASYFGEVATVGEVIARIKTAA